MQKHIYIPVGCVLHLWFMCVLWCYFTSSLISTQTFWRTLTAFVDRCAGKECPFGGTISYGTVWRKGCGKARLGVCDWSLCTDSHFFQCDCKFKNMLLYQWVPGMISVWNFLIFKSFCPVFKRAPYAQRASEKRKRKNRRKNKNGRKNNDLYLQKLPA